MLRVVGLMSGTSADGVDAALVEIHDGCRGTSDSATRAGGEPVAGASALEAWEGDTDARGTPPIQLGRVVFTRIPYSPDLRARVLTMMRPGASSVDEVCRMNFVLGEVFAAAALEVIRAAGLAPEDVDLIGSHGQTICHIPEPETCCGVRTRSTLQRGDDGEGDGLRNPGRGRRGYRDGAHGGVDHRELRAMGDSQVGAGHR